MRVSNMIYRKLLAGFLTAILFTLVVTLVFIFEFNAYESLGGGIIGISLVVAFYRRLTGCKTPTLRIRG